jgi:hypothetical protein
MKTRKSPKITKAVRSLCQGQRYKRPNRILVGNAHRNGEEAEIAESDWGSDLLNVLTG